MELVCQFCNKIFNKPYNLKRHLFLVHSDKKILKCDPDFEFKKRLVDNKEENRKPKRSIMDNITDGVFTCPKCPGKTFTKKKSLYSHNSVVHSMKRYQCTKCDKQFAFQSQLSRHQSHHSHSCSICHETFETFNKYQKHQAVHIVKKIVSCDICSASMVRKKLQCHMEKEHMNTRFSCKLCEQSYKYKRNLVHHIKTNHGEPKYACSAENCDKRFRTKTDLKRHVKDHEIDSKDGSEDEDMSDKSLVELVRNTMCWKRTYDTDLESIM